MRKVLVWAGLIVLGSCAERLPRPLEIERVEPDAVSAGAPATLRLVGSFEIDVHVNFDDRGGSSFDTTFAVAVGLVPATSVVWIDHTTLEVKFDAAPGIGVYDVTVAAPDGRTATASAAVTSRSGPVDCTVDGDCADPCYTVYSCVSGSCQYGTADKDSDGDGFVDATCAGGDDCDDDPGGCGNACAPSIPDICDGRDNDCDSGTADGVVIFGNACDGDDADLCDDDLITDCVAATPVCSSGADNLELCDNIDNDCNAATADGDDEASLGGPCDGPDSDLCADDTVTACTGGLLICSTGVDDVEGPDGDPLCTDSIDNDCDGATDLADADCGGANTAPLVSAVLTPALLEVGATLSADASQSTDREDASGALTVEWDWQGDATFDASGQTSTHSYATAGERTVLVRVTDTGGLSTTVPLTVIVADVGTVITVSTALDENDTGATPAAPGGAGFSLREAFRYANGTAGSEKILIPSGTTIVLGSGLPSLNGAEGATIVGDGAVVQGGGASTCIGLGADDSTLIGLEVTGCTSWGLQVSGDRVRVERVRIRSDGGGILVNGVDIVLGPALDITPASSNNGIQSSKPVTVMDSRINGGLRGIFLSVGSAGSILVGNTIHGTATGIVASVLASDTVIVNNTIVGATTSAADFASNIDSGIFVNNIVTNNALGVDGVDANFSTLDFNAWSANTGGDCSGCSSLGVNAVTEPPLFIDAVGGDFRLLDGSLLIDAGTDAGYDRNGSDAGSFNGTAPDIGAWEAP